VDAYDDVPEGRIGATAVWTGSEMIVWGGDTYTSTGGRYNPSTDTWRATSITNVPAARTHHTAIWTGSEMIIWGGTNGGMLNIGGRYNPTTNRWTAPAADIIPSQTVGQPPGPPTHPRVDGSPQQSGPAVK